MIHPVSMKKRVLMAMSGGVDSSLAAALLLEQGYEVIGAFMKNWSGSVRAPQEDGSFAFSECDWKTERRDALRVASQLGIPLHTFDFEKEYRERVYEYLLREYALGRTPNPDVMCNREVKFDLLLREADALNCAFLATGHYARVEKTDEHVRLLKGMDATKDQSYFLCRLGQKELSRALFPVGHLPKTEVRRQAEARGISTAQKKDSQGLCFVGKVKMPEFLAQRLAPKQGPIFGTDGAYLGTHQGIWFYTIGQREGLGIGGGAPFYVVERRLESNTLVVAQEGDPALFSSVLLASDVHWTSGKAPAFPWKGAASIRYHHPEGVCAADMRGDRLRVQFAKPERAVAPGQFLVLYEGDTLVGSGVIE